MSTSTVSLSPAEGCLARQISYWIGISAEGKGGSTDQLGRGWTYLSAEDLQGRVLDYDHIELSIPTIYRALRSLVTKGWFLREKLTSHRWYQVFHYTFGPNHPSISLKNGSNQSDDFEGIKPDGSQLSNPSQSSSSKAIKPIDIRREEQPNSRGSATPHEQPSASPINREEKGSQPLTSSKTEFVPAPTLCIEMYNNGEPTERVGFEPTVSANKREGFEPSIQQPLQSIKGAAPSALLEHLQNIEENYRGRLKELENPVGEEDNGLERGIHNPRVELVEPLNGMQELSKEELVEDPHGMRGVRKDEPIDARDCKSIDEEKAVVTLDTGSNERPPLPQSGALPVLRAHNPKVEQDLLAVGASSVMVTSENRSIWNRIRALASQFEPTQVETVSPSSVITKKGQRYRVDDGVTAPLR